MCGIVGYVGKRNAQDVLLDGLEKLEYRGYDSAGVALALEGGIRVVKSKGRLAELRKRLAVEALARSGCGIGHTRWATHGEPSDVNSHPHSTPRVSIVHNGIIENYGVLKERLMAKGYTFESETDTEVLVKLIDSCYEGEPLKALRAALAMVRGSYALAVLFRDFPDTLFAVKRESPLIVGWGEEENFIASDIPALLKYTRRYSVLEEGDMAVVNADSIRFYNEFAEPVEREVLTANWDQEAAEKGGYPHFMLKEINEQPAAITATVSPRVENGLPDLRVPELTDERLRRIGTVHLVGCGTAMHAGMVGKAAIEALARVPAQVEIASEFRYRNPILRPEDLVIIISQSGETSDTLAALKLAKSRGVPVLAIVNVVGSSIARAADYVMYTYAGPEIAVASTKAYMVQMCVLYLFALRLAYARGMQTDTEIRRLTAELLRAGEVIKPRLADCEQIKYLASRFVNTQSCFFIGRGFDYSLSLEGSLKLKEISYVHSDAYAAGELKHGTISLVTDGVPVIALATQKQVYEKTISNAKETKSRGAKVLLFTTRDAVVPDGVADYVVRLDDYDD
ncbi:MAG: glutamine--fructose-6-phosphate transaminase (isomerizing), partial [Faecalibacterium sp.]|nr:glutamine--fructose-6-phosphate transaminase (isomerizing) [Faecalibacterium sp.]